MAGFQHQQVASAALSVALCVTEAWLVFTMMGTRTTAVSDLLATGVVADALQAPFRAFVLLVYAVRVPVRCWTMMDW